METKYSAKCINGHFIKGVWADVKFERSNPKRGFLVCPCGSSGYSKRMEIEVNETKCGGRCQNATTTECRCSCGGENHGQHKVAFGAY